MSNYKTHIKIEVAIDDIRASLQKVIRSDYSPLIAETIITNLLKTEEGVKQLYLAMSGVKVCAKFKVLDKVLVKLDALATWRMDKDKTHEGGYTFKDKMKGVISEVDITATLPYRVSYKYISPSGQEEKDDYWLDEKNIELSNSNEII